MEQSRGIRKSFCFGLHDITKISGSLDIGTWSDVSVAVVLLVAHEGKSGVCDNLA